LIVPADTIQGALGLPAMNALATMAQTWAERLVKKHVGYEVESGTYSQFYPTNIPPQVWDALIDPQQWGLWQEFSPGFDRLYLEQIPVRSITAVYENPDQVWTSDYLTDPSQYRLDQSTAGTCESGALLRVYGAWDYVHPSGIRVDYTAGWTPDELSDIASDFQLAVTYTTLKIYNELVMNQAATITFGVGAVNREEMDDTRIYYDRAGQNFGMLQALPQAAREMIASRVRMGRYF
jgi:hypothetical protein